MITKQVMHSAIAHTHWPMPDSIPKPRSTLLPDNSSSLITGHDVLGYGNILLASSGHLPQQCSFPIFLFCVSSLAEHDTKKKFLAWTQLSKKKKSFQCVINVILMLNQNTVLYWEENDSISTETRTVINSRQLTAKHRLHGFFFPFYKKIRKQAKKSLSHSRTLNPSLYVGKKGKNCSKIMFFKYNL